MMGSSYHVRIIHHSSKRHFIMDNSLLIIEKREYNIYKLRVHNTFLICVFPFPAELSASQPLAQQMLQEGAEDQG